MQKTDLKWALNAVVRFRNELFLIDELSRDDYGDVIEDDLHGDCVSVLYRLRHLNRKLERMIEKRDSPQKWAVQEIDKEDEKNDAEPERD